MSNRNDLQEQWDLIHQQARELRQQVRDMNRVFGIRNSTRPTLEELLRDGHKWEPWWAWRPVRINRRWYWLTQVYRLPGNTYVDYDDWRWYYYGTLLDVLRSTEPAH